MNGRLKNDIIHLFPDLAKDKAQRTEILGTLSSMWEACIDRGSFGYSDHQIALTNKLPDLFRMIKPLIVSLDDFKRFCQAMPAILYWIPYNSENTPIGYIHTILTDPYENRVKSSKTLDDFLKAFEGYPVSVCSDCGKDMTVTKNKDNYTVRCSCGYWWVGG